MLRALLNTLFGWGVRWFAGPGGPGGPPEEGRRHFPEGLDVAVPAQRSGKVVRPRRGPEERPGATPVFEPYRLVMNLVFFSEGDPETLEQEFDPPVELRIWYRQAEVERAQEAGKELAMAFWRGGEWILFTAEKHGFELVQEERGEFAGYGRASLSNWEDPMIGVGG